MDIEDIKQKVAPVLKKHNVSYAGIFGSVAKGNDRPDSDVDILVKFQKTPGFFGYLELKEALEAVLGKTVDLPTTRSLNKNIKDEVYKDLVPIYGRQK